MKAGDKVRIVRDVAPYPLGFFPAGTTGTVVSRRLSDGSDGGIVAIVKLDQHFACLNAWNNELQVFADSGPSEIVLSLFEVVGDDTPRLVAMLRTCIAELRALHAHTVPTQAENLLKDLGLWEDRS